MLATRFFESDEEEVLVIIHHEKAKAHEIGLAVKPTRSSNGFGITRK